MKFKQFFSQYGKTGIDPEKQTLIDENRQTVQSTIECIRRQLDNAVLINADAELDSTCTTILSVMDTTKGNESYINFRQGPRSMAQKQMIAEIEMINDLAHEQRKMCFVADLMNKKYFSAKGIENIGTCVCSFTPVNASKAVTVLADDNNKPGLYFYIGTPSKEGVAYLFAKDDKISFFTQLQEFHMLSLWRDPVKNYFHGLLLSYNPARGWQNICFSIIMKQSQDMVWNLLQEISGPSRSWQPSDEFQASAGSTCPWQR